MREVSVFQVADNAVSNLTFSRLIEKNARHLSAHAYAYRRDLTVHDAVLHVFSDFQGKSRTFVAEFDFSKFFDSISHDHIRRVLKDQRFFVTEREHNVIDAFLRAPSLAIADYSLQTTTERGGYSPRHLDLPFLGQHRCVPVRSQTRSARRGVRPLRGRYSNLG